MAPPARGAATTDSSVEVTWTTLSSPANGDSAVTSYELEWDAGGGTLAAWQPLVGASPAYLLSSYVVTAGITAGASYRFRVRARNYWGNGAYSLETSVQAATTPGTPAAPVTSIAAAGGAVVITWVAPGARGDPISTYYVEIAAGGANAGNWRSETTYCGGSAAVTCTVPMSELWGGVYTLPQGQLIAVRVTAVNSYGPGTASAASTGSALVRTVPAQMT